MRISTGGAFVHANPATIGVQGRLNVSHGCVNISVDVIHAVVKPVLWDAGMADGNDTWAEWKAGSSRVRRSRSRRCLSWCR